MSSIINYAHRGCSEFYPENTLYSFYMGLSMKADGIETDIQRTRDGVLVLFHDNDLQRILGIEGRICDFTYAELLAMDFGRYKGPAFAKENIVTLEEFLLHFGRKDLTFALEIKQIGVEKETLAMIRRFQVQDKVIITSFEWESLMNVRAVDPDIRVGYLVEHVTDDLFDRLLAHHIQQVCPHIDAFTPEQFARARAMGLSIRYWGISSPDRMQKAIDMDADGMTINNPAALSKALGRL